MKNLVIPFFALLLLVGCKNSSSNASTAETQNLPPELNISAEQVKTANTKAQASMQSMLDLISEMNVAAQSFPEAKKEELNVLRTQISEILEKQKMMAEGLASAAAPAASTATSDGGAVPPPGVLKDYIESASNYDQILNEIKANFETLKNK